MTRMRNAEFGVEKLKERGAVKRKMTSVRSAECGMIRMPGGRKKDRGVSAMTGGGKTGRAIPSCQVIGIEDWSRRRYEGQPSNLTTEFSVARFKMLSKAQKQAALLKYIVSDEIGDAELDSMATAIKGN